MKKELFILSMCLLCVPTVFSQDIKWKNSNWEGHIGQNGCLKQLVFKGKSTNDTIPFLKKEGFAGPAFYAEINGKTIKAEWVPDGYLSYKSEIDKVVCQMKYDTYKGNPCIKVTLTNKGNVPFQPTKAGMKLGVDTYMDTYPQWFGKYFPTLARNEKTHFYGYLQNPAGHMLGIVSPQPIASWSVDYNLGYQDPAPLWFMGHRIESLNLDLINALPLPSRHPQHLWELKQGESKTWNIAFVNIKDSNLFEKTIYKASQLPIINIEQTNYTAGQVATFDVLASKNARINICDDQQKEIDFTSSQLSNGLRICCKLPVTGLYTISVNDHGYITEGILSAHATWKWTLEKARENAWKYKQKATSHIESWMGFNSAFLAAKYFPNKELDQKLDQRFEYLFNLLHDKQKMEPKFYKSRIQNTSGTIGLLVDRYEAFNRLEDLKTASKLADWLIDNYQREDGAYQNRGIVYTSVVYVAKSIMELMFAEQELGKTDATWAEAAKRHRTSVHKAITQLIEAKGNFETEGQMTFEDGMVACSSLQIGLYALMEKDPAARKYYTEEMMRILESHECLAQLHVPDARRRGGTMRYWEAQYDVQMLPNMFNSPHGWSGWRAYATYYAYLLTGNEMWLKQTYNAMGAFSHLIDYKTGNLRWAFVVDPYLQVEQACSADSRLTADSLSFGNPHPKLYDTRKFVIGEQYVNMISDWQGVNTQDNDVHELFKFMEEAMLTNAFIVEQPDGSVKGYNCIVKQQGKKLTVIPDEKQIVNLHCNLNHEFQISFRGKAQNLSENYLGWAFGKDPYQ